MERSDPGGIRPTRLAAGIGAVVLVDAATKFVAVDQLALTHVPHPFLGEVLRWTLVYNPGAAFGLNLGSWSRPIFIALTFVALGLLWSLYRQTAPTARTRVLAIAAVTAGAVGNLVDRIRSPRGVVDFVDIGFGDWRWPTFNVADSAVTIGALALIVILWREESALQKK